MRDRQERAFSVERAEAILAGPLSEDLPENIEAIEAAVGKAYIAGEIDLMEPSGSLEPKLIALLQSKGLMPAWDMKDLAHKVARRLLLGGSSWDFGLKEVQLEHLALYQKLKDRPSVQKAVEVGGLCQGTFLVIRSIKAIDEKLDLGGTYNDVYHSIIYFDDLATNHAFLNHVEERFQTDIKSKAQLFELAKITPTTYESYKASMEANGDGEETCSPAKFTEVEEAQDPYILATIDRFGLALDKTIREGGKYQDLLALNPQDFGLPEMWKYPYDLGPQIAEKKKWGVDTSKESMILRTINLHYEMGDPTGFRAPLREIANQLEAPYGVILKASGYYE